ncbi:hypothetical protein RchiOBHm_Chr6g0247651 [Rosa chinensis]|uniref:Transmembrane protein n=1 Tax=Rosa chinensis TaxID=74649 RepID=A0A2P6PJU9_ROSCH|nr:hypothetical protein RchiOBHm_Chr6g0247651 [Rosa chinensis]
MPTVSGGFARSLSPIRICSTFLCFALPLISYISNHPFHSIVLFFCCGWFKWGFPTSALGEATRVCVSLDANLFYLTCSFHPVYPDSFHLVYPVVVPLVSWWKNLGVVMMMVSVLSGNMEAGRFEFDMGLARSIALEDLCCYLPRRGMVVMLPVDMIAAAGVVVRAWAFLCSCFLSVGLLGLCIRLGRPAGLLCNSSVF